MHIAAEHEPEPALPEPGHVEQGTAGVRQTVEAQRIDDRLPEVAGDFSYFQGLTHAPSVPARRTPDHYGVLLRAPRCAGGVRRRVRVTARPEIFGWWRRLLVAS